jgi:hypothetical protein
MKPLNKGRVMTNERRIDEHLEEFVELLKNGECRQLVMENNESEDDLWFGGETSEQYRARINDPNNYAYIINRYKTAERTAIAL